MNEKKETKNAHAPHDRGYKRSLSRPKEFLHFLKKYVRADWMMELEESQLSLCDKEFVDKDYEGREADLIYRVSREAGEEIYIFILQEHAGLPKGRRTVWESCAESGILSGESVCD